MLSASCRIDSDAASLATECACHGERAAAASSLAGGSATAAAATSPCARSDGMLATTLPPPAAARVRARRVAVSRAACRDLAAAALSVALSGAAFARAGLRAEAGRCASPRACGDARRGTYSRRGLLLRSCSEGCG
jgi:hypothetical protein